MPSSLIDPYRGAPPGATWLKGNLHTHTTRSDGSRPPQEVIDDYAQRGYDFLMISDHDICTSEEDYGQWDSRGMVMIPGNEITANGVHLLHVNASCRVEPVADRQDVISRATSDPGSFVIVNHPNWGKNFAHCRKKWLSEWTGYAGLEIYNGVCEYLSGSAFATDHWDVLLGAGRRVWGFANDDHHWHDREQIAMGFNVALAERNLKSIVEALAAGRFYASTGVVIRKVESSGARVRIETENADRIIAYEDLGTRFADARSNSLEVELPEDATYMRIECHGPQRTFAWTQPFFRQ